MPWWIRSIHRELLGRCDVDSDVGLSGQTAVGVVGEVAGLGFSCTHGAAQGEVASGPVVEVDTTAARELVTSMVQSWVTPSWA